MFVGDIGGYMGLLLGASVVTVWELLDVLMVTCISKTVSWIQDSNKTTAKTKYYSDTYDQNVLQQNDQFSFGYSNGKSLIKSQSMHSLSNGIENKDLGISSLMSNVKPDLSTKSPNYKFERSVFAFDGGDPFSN